MSGRDVTLSGDRSHPAAMRVELDDRGELSDIGMTAQMLQPRDQVIVVVSPARREPNHLYPSRLDRPTDGYSFEQVGGRPRLLAGHSRRLLPDAAELNGK